MKANNFIKGINTISEILNKRVFSIEWNTFDKDEDIPTEPINGGKIMAVTVTPNGDVLLSSDKNGVLFVYEIGVDITDETFLDYLFNVVYGYYMDEEEEGTCEDFIVWYDLDK